MIHLRLDHAHVAPDQISREATRLLPAVDLLRRARTSGYEKPDGFVNLPFDQKQVDTVRRLAEEVRTPNLTYVFVLGIGGSHLGTQALYDSLRHTVQGQHPAPVFLEYLDPVTREEVAYFIETHVKRPDQILVNVVTKSGDTAETLLSAQMMLDILSKKFGDPLERFVFTTGPDSALARFARKNNRPVLEIPPAVAGRYSVFSAVGLFPLYLAGVDVDAILAGARSVTTPATELDSMKNPALLLSALGNIYYRAGVRVQNLFLEHRRLGTVGAWWRQLVAESTNKIVEGKPVGILPTVYIAPGDNHSVLEHYLSGPSGSLTQYLTIERMESIPARSKGTFIEMLTKGKSTELPDITTSYREEIFSSFSARSLPIAELLLPEISAHSMGAFLQFQMMATTILCRGLYADPYTQPDIDTFKQRLRARFM